LGVKFDDLIGRGDDWIILGASGGEGVIGHFSEVEFELASIDFENSPQFRDIELRIQVLQSFNKQLAGVLVTRLCVAEPHLTAEVRVAFGRAGEGKARDGGE
jgi:hypothetical protein